MTIQDTEPGKLRELLHGRVDHDRCPRCGVSWDISPTVAVGMTADETILWTAGTLATDDAATLAVSRAAARAVLPDVVKIPDLDRLRDEVRRRLGRHFVGLAGSLGPALQWRRLRPWVLTAVALAVEGDLALPDELAPFGLADPAPERRRLAVAVLQVRVWQALAAEWMAGGSGLLQDDLDSYVVAGASGTPPDVLMTLLAEAGSVSGPYAWEAVLAAVARSLHVVNPAADAWAEIYLAHEAACVVRPGGATEAMLAARVTPAFAAATVEYGSAWTAAAAVLTLLTGGSADDLAPRNLAEACAAIAPALARAGHSRLLDALLETRLVSTLAGAASAAEIVADVLPWVHADGWDAAAALAGLHLDHQLPERRAACTDEVAARLLDAVGPARRTEAIIWWARRLNHDRRFADTLRLLGEHPTMDDDSGPAARARLWGALAAALDGSGEPDEALAVWRRVVALLEDAGGVELPDGDRSLTPWARVNLADLLARTGSVDTALEILDDVVRSDYGCDPELLIHLAAIQRRCGRGQEADRLLAEATRLAGPAARRDLTLLQGAADLAANGRPAEAAAVMQRTAPAQVDVDDRLVLAEADAWAAILLRADVRGLPADAPERVAHVSALLIERAGVARARGDVAGQATLLGAAARLDHRPDAPIWDELVALRRGHALADVPEELIRAARARLDGGDRAGMRALLRAVPAAMAARYGAVRDLALLVEEPRALLRPLAALAGRVAENAPAADADLALVGELQRDALGRARTAHLHVQASHRSTAPPEPRAALPVDLPPFTVVEWIRTGEQSLRCVASRVENGCRAAEYLRLAPSDPIALRRRVASRVDTWSRAGLGSPLAVPAWRELAESFVEQLATVAEPGDHVVVLHDPVFGGLPWHVAMSSRWTCSYSAGWSHLVDVLRMSTPVRCRRGVAVRPRTRSAICSRVRRRRSSSTRARARRGPPRSAPSSTAGPSVFGDLADLDESRGVAEQVTRPGRMNAVIHNAGVYDGPASCRSTSSPPICSRPCCTARSGWCTSAAACTAAGGPTAGSNGPGGAGPPTRTASSSSPTLAVAVARLARTSTATRSTPAGSRRGWAARAPPTTSASGT